MDQQYKGWGIIPQFITRSTELDVYEKVMLAYFLSFIGMNNDTCYPSLSLITEELGICRETAVSTIKKLVAKNYIEKEKGTKNKSNRYKILFELSIGRRKSIAEYGCVEEEGSLLDRPSGSLPHRLGVVRHIDCNNNILKEVVGIKETFKNTDNSEHLKEPAATTSDKKPEPTYYKGYKYFTQKWQEKHVTPLTPIMLDTILELFRRHEGKVLVRYIDEAIERKSRADWACEYIERMILDGAKSKTKKIVSEVKK